MADPQDAEIERVASRMYSECYIGHIPWEQWKKFAEFCIRFKDETKQETEQQ